jgi:UDP-glucose 4-epimerase
MKRALVSGAGGFIGGHLVKKLKTEGFWVRGVDIKEHEFAPTQADEFLLLDLRKDENCQAALSLVDGRFDEVYQLAADMGGMGFIHSAECEIMHNSALINIHMIHNSAEMGMPRYFFSSSVCVYRDMKPGEAEMSEDEAIPAHPDNEYGWEKFYSQIFRYREVTLTVAKAFHHVGLKVDGEEIGSNWNTASLQPFRQGIAVNFSGQSNYIDEPGHARGEWFDSGNIHTRYLSQAFTIPGCHLITLL